MMVDVPNTGDYSASITLPPNGIPLESVEFELSRQAFERTGGNLTRAAKLLDISRDQLRYKLRKAGYETASED
jgi:DNA-binding NtrC family response regulator